MYGMVGAILMVVGSVAFLVGTAVATPRTVKKVRDPDDRAAMLNQNLGRWRGGSYTAAVGAVVTSFGVFVLMRDSVATVMWCGLAGLLLLFGALAWGFAAYRRVDEPYAYVIGLQSAWPVVAYTYLTIAALAFLGVGLLVEGQAWWLGAGTIALALSFLGVFLKRKDVPAPLFYLVLGGIATVSITLGFFD